jgi:hypothetical protein
MAERTHTINHDRLSVIIGLVLLSLALIPLLNAPGRSVGGSILGSALDIAITPAGLITLLAAGLACAGVDLLIQPHPHVRAGRAGQTFVFWILPALTVIAASQWLSQASSGPAWAAQLLASGAALWFIIRAEFGSVDPDAPAAGRWRLVLNVLAYVLAFGLFALIWQTRARSLITATLMAVAALLLSVDLMWVTRTGARRVLMHSLPVALVIGQCAWALNYWKASTAIAGLALVLIFYALSGIAAQHLFEKLTRRVLAEFGLIIAAALVLLILGTPN